MVGVVCVCPSAGDDETERRQAVDVWLMRLVVRMVWYKRVKSTEYRGRGSAGEGQNVNIRPNILHTAWGANSDR